MTDWPLTLVRLGAALTALGVVLSLWASPDRLASLPHAAVALAGSALVLTLTGRLLPTLARRVRSKHVAGFFLTITLLALATTLLATRWPIYKLSWLNDIYAAIPSIRSLPLAWTAEGLQPNQTGGILAVCTAFAVSVALARPPVTRRSHRWIPGTLGVLGFLVVFMTGSRAALAGLALAALLVLMVRTARRLWVWAAGAAVLLLGLVVSGQLGKTVDFFLRDESLGTKLMARLDIWSSALRGIQDHLLTGIGLNVFNQVMPTRYPYETVGLSYPVSQAHNLLLDVTLAVGLPGLLGVVALLAGSVLLGVRCMRRDPLTRAVALGLIASMLAFVVFGITDSISLSIPTSFIMWLWASSLAALDRRGR